MYIHCEQVTKNSSIQLEMATELNYISPQHLIKYLLWYICINLYFFIIIFKADSFLLIIFWKRRCGFLFNKVWLRQVFVMLPSGSISTCAILTAFKMSLKWLSIKSREKIPIKTSGYKGTGTLRSRSVIWLFVLQRKLDVIHCNLSCYVNRGFCPRVRMNIGSYDFSLRHYFPFNGV